jgi:hypothetical protein
MKLKEYNKEYNEAEFVAVDIDLKEFVNKEPRLLLSSAFSDEFDCALKNYMRVIEYGQSKRKAIHDQRAYGDVDSVRKSCHDEATELFLKDMYNLGINDFDFQKARKEIGVMCNANMPRFRKNNRIILLNNIMDIYEIRKFQKDMLQQKNELKKNKYN